MSLTLWGRKSSANVQKAVWALEEFGLVYEHIEVGGRFGGTNTPEYLAMNPNGLVPTLRDGDLTLWESHAIVRYLAAEYGSGLLFPLTSRERALVDQWTDWTATTFQPTWINLFWLAVRTPKPEQNPEAIAKAFAATVRCFEMLETRLGQAPYLGGDALSYADIAAGAAMYRWATMDIDRPSLPNVEDWHARLNDRAAFRQAVNFDYSELVGRLAF